MSNDRTGDVAQKLGLGVETLRYYERIGLVSSPSRTSTGRRLYSDEDIKRLAFVKRARELEFSLDEIRQLLELSVPENFSCEKIQSIASAALERSRARLLALQYAERALAAAIEQCPTASGECCPILDRLSNDAQYSVPKAATA